MSKVFSVAIDGPVGAGKSCVAKKVAERLNAAYLDTGAMYRAVGLYMLENGVSLEDGAAIAENAGKARVDVRYEGREQRTYLNGEDVSSVAVDLANYTESSTTLLDTWTMVDLKPLGEVSSIYFTFESTDSGQWGINPPTYVAIDRLKVRYQF